MCIIKFRGKIQKQSFVELPNKVQVLKILFKEILPEAYAVNMEPNYYEVFIYGKKEILNFWEDYDNKRPEPIVELEAKLNGRLKIGSNQKEYNNLTLSFKNKKFIYEHN